MLENISGIKSKAGVHNITHMLINEIIKLFENDIEYRKIY